MELNCDPVKVNGALPLIVFRVTGFAFKCLRETISDLAQVASFVANTLRFLVLFFLGMLEGIMIKSLPFTKVGFSVSKRG